jgi:superfamily II DNA or RNA helicase
MSATPRIYETEERIGEITEFRNIIYKMLLSDAIKNKYICDYRLYFPYIEHTDDAIIDSIDNKVAWFFNCVCKLSLKKIIVYCKSTDDLVIIGKKMISEYKNFGIEKIYIRAITNEISHKKRIEIFNDFKSNNNYLTIILSIRILDEGIDLPCCDSIFVTYDSNSKIRNIQRIMRATRKYHEKMCASILCWCTDTENIDFLASIKAFDPELSTKIQVKSVKYNEKTDTNNGTIETVKENIIKQIIGIKE